MKGVADLAVIPQKFIRKERIVADVQISAGWLHSGYPIMMHSSIGGELFNPEDARTKGLWGEVHELGHNQQRTCWEFSPHTTEATCNLWSVYVHEEVLGLNRAKVTFSFLTDTRPQRLSICVAHCSSKQKNKNICIILTLYFLVFARYHDMRNFPVHNEEKMNLYAETFSKATEMNLTGFFKAWGWPIKPATEEKLNYIEKCFTLTQVPEACIHKCYR
uniref:Peptidase M60 domain-containing protein n=1 Tax=Cyprinodon variegatus TaxID=28743 RepID=A0A3Q2D9Z1_CYPVA